MVCTCPIGPIGPVLNFCSLGFYRVPLGFILVLLGFNSLVFRVTVLFCFWGPVLCPYAILSPIDIFKFLLRKKGWVEL